MIDEKGLEAAAKAAAMIDGINLDWITDQTNPLWRKYRQIADAAITAYLSARSAEPVALSGALDVAMRDALVHGAGFTVTRIAPADLAHPKEAPDV